MKTMRLGSPETYLKRRVHSKMIENLAPILKKEGFDCRTVYEWIDGKKQKTREIHDAEVRRFLKEQKSKGEPITLITADSDSWEQVNVDNLDVIYVQHVLRDYIKVREDGSK